MAKGIEAGLLFLGVGRRRTGCCLLQGSMEALMAPVLLGLAGLDPLEGDAGLEPVQGQAGQPAAAKGGPLSERIALGRPWRSKAFKTNASTGR